MMNLACGDAMTAIQVIMGVIITVVDIIKINQLSKILLNLSPIKLRPILKGELEAVQRADPEVKLCRFT